MTGTIVNTAAIAIGSFAGVFFGKKLKEEVSESCLKSVGIAVLIVGLSGVLSIMLSSDSDGTIEANGGMSLLISLVLGTAIGEMLKLEDRLTKLSDYFEMKLHIDGFSKGFVNSSILFCSGAMAIIGSFNDGLYGDSSLLIIKSVMDGASAIFLASTLGIGVAFSAIAIFFYQGALTVFAGFLAPILSDQLMNDFSMVGFAIVMCIGLNMMGATKFKTSNMVPALFVILVLQFIPWF